MKGRTWASVCALSVAGLFGLVSRNSETERQEPGPFGRYLQEVTNRLEKHKPDGGWESVSKREFSSQFRSFSNDQDVVRSNIDQEQSHVAVGNQPVSLLTEDSAQSMQMAVDDVKNGSAYSGYTAAFNVIFSEEIITDDDRAKIVRQYFGVDMDTFMTNMDTAFLTKQRSLQSAIDSYGMDFSNLNKEDHCQLLAHLWSKNDILSMRRDLKRLRELDSFDMIDERDRNLRTIESVRMQATVKPSCRVLDA